MTLLSETISNIQSLDGRAMQAARERKNQLTRPQGSLGRLEEISIQLAGISGQERPLETRAIQEGLQEESSRRRTFCM
jgi:nicotinate-nucleotide--dimethylbenzimidazole phosphoribosyltransferase